MDGEGEQLRKRVWGEYEGEGGRKWDYKGGRKWGENSSEEEESLTEKIRDWKF